MLAKCQKEAIGGYKRKRHMIMRMMRSKSLWWIIRFTVVLPAFALLIKRRERVESGAKGIEDGSTRNPLWSDYTGVCMGNVVNFFSRSSGVRSPRPAPKAFWQYRRSEACLSCHCQLSSFEMYGRKRSLSLHTHSRKHTPLYAYINIGLSYTPHTHLF